jgi:hypothetical protein
MTFDVQCRVWRVGNSFDDLTGTRWRMDDDIESSARASRGRDASRFERPPCRICKQDRVQRVKGKIGNGFGGFRLIERVDCL